MPRSGLVPRTVYHCPECGQEWTDRDNPNEWAYGHDCEEVTP